MRHELSKATQQQPRLWSVTSAISFETTEDGHEGVAPFFCTFSALVRPSCRVWKSCHLRLEPPFPKRLCHK